MLLLLIFVSYPYPRAGWSPTSLVLLCGFPLFTMGEGLLASLVSWLEKQDQKLHMNQTHKNQNETEIIPAVFTSDSNCLKH